MHDELPFYLNLIPIFKNSEPAITGIFFNWKIRHEIQIAAAAAAKWLLRFPLNKRMSGK